MIRGTRSLLRQVVYPGGAGYSDLRVLPGGSAGEDRLGVAFQRTLYEHGVEGGGYNIAFASMTVPLKAPAVLPGQVLV